MRLVTPVYTLSLAGSLFLTGCFPMYGPYGNPYGGVPQNPYGASPYGSPYGVPAGGAYPYGQPGIQTLTPGGTYTPVNPGTSNPGTFGNGTLQPIPGGGTDVTVPGPYNGSGANSPYMGSPTTQLGPLNEAAVAGYEEPSALPGPTSQLRQINQAQPFATAQNPDQLTAPAASNPAPVSTAFPPAAQADPFLSPQPVATPNANNPWATPSAAPLAPVAPVAPAEEPAQTLDIFGAPMGN